MSEIIKVYRQSMPAMKFVGRCYGENDKVNGTFSEKWGEWFRNDLFAPLERKQKDETFIDAYYGLCRCCEGEPFQYWIGVFMPETAETPSGYESLSFDAGDVAACWIYGKEPDIYSHCSLSRLKEEGYEWAADKNGVKWCFERYASPRFTTPDEKGNVILDMCFYVR